MSVSDLLKNTVSISDFNHGKSSKIFSRVMDGATVVVMKNNAPAAVIVDVKEYQRLMEAEALVRQLRGALEHNLGTGHLLGWLAAGLSARQGGGRP